MLLEARLRDPRFDLGRPLSGCSACKEQSTESLSFKTRRKLLRFFEIYLSIANQKDIALAQDGQDSPIGIEEAHAEPVAFLPCDSIYVVKRSVHQMNRDMLSTT